MLIGNYNILIKLSDHVSGDQTSEWSDYCKNTQQEFSERPLMCEIIKQSITES